MKQKRPVNLDLGTLSYPPMAIASILHRLSGIILFLLFPFALYLFNLSLHSETTFQDMQMLLTGRIYKFFIWVFCSALSYHVFAGVRHILMDIGFGERLQTARNTAVFVIVLAILSTILLGIWIW